jgi:Uncharacterized protein conserved in bacteria (DUF2188)
VISEEEVMRVTKKANVHVVPRDDGWAVKRDGGQRASSVHTTQAAADDAGRATARRDGVEFLLHNKQGEIRARDSYGNDPCPPKG